MAVWALIITLWVPGRSVAMVTIPTYGGALVCDAARQAVNDRPAPPYVWRDAVCVETGAQKP